MGIQTNDSKIGAPSHTQAPIQALTLKFLGTQTEVAFKTTAGYLLSRTPTSE